MFCVSAGKSPLCDVSRGTYLPVIVCKIVVVSKRLENSVKKVPFLILSFSE